MVESINAELNSNSGTTTKKKADQKFHDGEGKNQNTRPLEEASDGRSNVHKFLEGAHERVTGKVGKTTTQILGATGLAGLGEAIAYDSPAEPVFENAVELTAQYPEASTALIGTAGALALYNGADEIGLLSNARESLNPGQFFSDSKFVEVDEEWNNFERYDEDEDKDYEALGTHVNHETVRDFVSEPFKYLALKHEYSRDLEGKELDSESASSYRVLRDEI